VIRKLKLVALAAVFLVVAATVIVFGLWAVPEGLFLAGITCAVALEAIGV
jgi:hypothetical protein